jgi:hypothetical protein
MRIPFLGRLVVNLPFPERILFFATPVVLRAARFSMLCPENL